MQTQSSKSEIINYILFVVRKRKGLFFSVGLTTFLSIIFFTYLTTPTWEATTNVLIERTSKQNLNIFRDVNVPVGVSNRGQEGLDLLPLLIGKNMAYDLVREYALDERLKSKKLHPKSLREKIKNLIMDIMLSPKTLLQEIGILKKGVKNWTDSAVEDFLEEWEDIAVEEGTSVIVITIHGETRKLAMDISNRMVELLREKTQQFTRTGAKAPFDFIKNQLLIAEKNLMDAEVARARFKEEANIVILDEEKRMKLTKLGEYEAELLTTLKQHKEIKAQLDVINRGFEKQDERLALSTTITKNPVATQLESSLETLEIKLVSLLTEQRRGHPEIQRVTVEIQETLKKLKSIVDTDLKTEIFALKVRESELQKIIKNLKAELRSLPEKEIKLARLQTLVESNKAVYQALITRIEELPIEQGSMINEYNIRMLDRAYVSESASSDWPKWLLNILAGVFLSFVFGFGSIFFIEYWNDSVINPRDIEEDILLPYLGSVPYLKNSTFAHRKL